MLKLIEFDYIENKGLPNEWAIEKCAIESVNLFVAKNAVGKSRILERLHSLAEMISEQRETIDRSNTLECKLVFSKVENEDKIEFSLVVVRSVVIIERMLVNATPILVRDYSGAANFFDSTTGITSNERINSTDLALYELSFRYQLLEDFRDWANCFCYSFHSFAIAQIVNDTETPGGNLFNMFVNGKLWGEDTKYVQAIVSDMAATGYPISDLGVKMPTSSNQSASIVDLYGLPRCLFIRENENSLDTEQLKISKGMFRVLATLIRANYLLYSSAIRPSCFIVDDLAEGLDAECATRLTKLLLDKFALSGSQLIFTTNNEYVMNAVPIEYWSLIERLPNGVRLKNRHNSQKEIEEFNFLGLNNFDYFRQNQG